MGGKLAAAPSTATRACKLCSNVKPTMLVKFQLEPHVCVRGLNTETHEKTNRINVWMLKYASKEDKQQGKT
jgi:hypothetical protein